METFISNFRKLIVWKEAKNLTLQIYRITYLFPKEELYVLTAQMKRASISVASNLAEGNQRRSDRDRMRFFNIAQGSLVELESQLEIALELKFISTTNYEKTLEHINKTGYLLTKFIKSEIDRTNPTNRTNPNN